MKARKILVSLAALALVAAISIGGTLAYLTQQKTVTNTFTVGNVTITMDETDVDDSTKDAARDTENSYKLLPGKTYTKDPIIHVDTNSESCYLFVTIKNEIAAIEDANNSVEKQMEAKGWAKVTGVTGVENLYVYIGTEKNASDPKVVAAGADVTVFDQIVIKGEGVTNESLAAYTGKTIVVKAYAIQAEGFSNKSAAEIWTAAGFTA